MTIYRDIWVKNKFISVPILRINPYTTRVEAVVGNPRPTGWKHLRKLDRDNLKRARY